MTENHIISIPDERNLEYSYIYSDRYKEINKIKEYSQSKILLPYVEFENRIQEEKEVPFAETAIQWIEDIAIKMTCSSLDLALIIEQNEENLHNLIGIISNEQVYNERVARFDKDAIKWERGSKLRNQKVWQISCDFISKYSGIICRVPWNKPIADADTCLLYTSPSPRD